MAKKGLKFPKLRMGEKTPKVRTVGETNEVAKRMKAAERGFASRIKM